MNADNGCTRCVSIEERIEASGDPYNRPTRRIMPSKKRLVVRRKTIVYGERAAKITSSDVFIVGSFLHVWVR